MLLHEPISEVRFRYLVFARLLCGLLLPTFGKSENAILRCYLLLDFFVRKMGPLHGWHLSSLGVLSFVFTFFMSLFPNGVPGKFGPTLKSFELRTNFYLCNPHFAHLVCFLCLHFPLFDYLFTFASLDCFLSFDVFMFSVSSFFLLPSLESFSQTEVQRVWADL